MNKKIISVLFLLAYIVSPAQNLLKNGAFDAPALIGEAVLQQTHGKVKLSLETEHLSWNRCLRMQITALNKSNQLNCMLYMGKTGETMGFPVEPDSSYDFSFEIKGNSRIALWATLYNKACGREKLWAGRNIRPTPGSAKGETDSWTRVKGSFRTGRDTRFATLNFQFWANGKQKNQLIGKYVLLDNIRVIKRNTITSGVSVSKVAPEKIRPALVLPGTTELSLPGYRHKNQLPLAVESSADEKNIRFAVTLPPAAANLTTVSRNGTEIWQDDVVELFFAPLSADRGFTQFALASGGGRFYRAGSNTGMFEQWQGKCETLEDNKRKFSFVIPWQLLGTGPKVADGGSVGFNIGIQCNKKSYTFPSVRGNFRDVENFGTLIFGSVRSYRERSAAGLKNVPDELVDEVKKFSTSENNDPGQAVAEFVTLQKQINSARLGKEVFLAARLDLNSNFSHPLEITPGQLIKKTIKLAAARNETIYLPLAVMNRTGKPAAYRVVVHKDKNNFNSAETTGLTGNFPCKNIIYREALIIKDSNGKVPGMIYDPLPEMNQAKVITIPAHSTGIIFVEFDCHGAAAGKYTGSLRIIPLNEWANFKRNQYSGALKDYPLELEIMDITLPDPMPANMFWQGISQDYVNKFQRLGQPILLVSSFYFPFKFDEKGNILSSKAPAAVKIIEQYKKYFQTAVRKDKPRFMVGYSVYDVFKRTALPKSIKVFTPEWENCWKNYFKTVCKVISDCGIAPTDVSYEMVDEPRIKYEKEYLTMVRLAKEAVPDARLMMTWGPLNFGYTVEKITPYEPYLSEHFYHWLLLGSSEHLEHIKHMNSTPGVKTGMYECNTSIRENLHTYFHLHPWRVYLNGFDTLGFYQFTANPWGQPGAVDWKVSPRGELTYRADDLCVPSIRMLALQQGVDDIRYLMKLEEKSNIPEIANFLQEYKEKVMKNSNNSALPAEFRSKAKELLKKHCR